MKKIFTLLFVVGMFTMAQAQPGSRFNQQADTRYNQQGDTRYNQQVDPRYNQQTDQRGFNKGYQNGRDVVVNNSYSNDGRYDRNSSFDRDKDMQIARINQEFQFKIERVKRSFFMSWYEKQRQISFLQEQRQREISMIYARNSGWGNRGFGNDDRGDHSYRH